MVGDVVPEGVEGPVAVKDYQLLVGEGLPLQGRVDDGHRRVVGHHQLDDDELGHVVGLVIVHVEGDPVPARVVEDHVHHLSLGQHAGHVGLPGEDQGVPVGVVRAVCGEGHRGARLVGRPGGGALDDRHGRVVLELAHVHPVGVATGPGEVHRPSVGCQASSLDEGVRAAEGGPLPLERPGGELDHVVVPEHHAHLAVAGEGAAVEGLPGVVAYGAPVPVVVDPYGVVVLGGVVGAHQHGVPPRLVPRDREEGRESQRLGLEGLGQARAGEV